MEQEKFIVKKEMALTHSDFFRWLPNALRGKAYRVRGSYVQIESLEGMWTIQLGKESMRHIALLSIPKTVVTMVFQGYTEKNFKTALQYFDRAFHRGGG